MNKVSQYLVSYEINNNYNFIYNSLYGNGRIVSKDLYNMLIEKNRFEDEEYINLIGRENLEEFKRCKFIYEDDCDEREQIGEELKIRESELPTGKFFERLHISTTNQCNMGCKYCFCENFDYDDSKETERFPKNRMDFSVAKSAMEKSINTILKNNKNYLSVEFFGGEPLLNPDLIIQVLETFGDGSQYGISIEYGCTTNGTQVDDRLLPYLKKYDVRIAISIDYIDYEDGSFRGDGTTNIKWNTIDKNIQKLISNNIKVKFQSVLSEETWGKSKKSLIDYAAANQIEAMGLILSFDFDFYTKYPYKTIADRVLEIYDYAQSKNIQITGYWHQSFLGIINPDEWEERRAWKTCPTIGRLLSVEPNGKVFACKTTAKSLGELDNFNEIFSNEEYKYYAMRAYTNAEKCAGCEIEGFCSGNCTGAVENKYKDIYAADDQYCKTVKQIVDGLMHRYCQEIAESLN